MVCDVQFLVIHGRFPPTRLCNAILCTCLQSINNVNCASPLLTPPTVPAYRFLLKYVSRDEVQVLAKGNGGTVEMRNNIAQYEETSPLFGLLRYRRRNVIIKYLPEGCSRLIQGMSQASYCFIAVACALCPYNSYVPPWFAFKNNLLIPSPTLQRDSPSTSMRSASASPHTTRPSTLPRPRN